MSNTKHTPGNWKIDDSEDNIVRVISPWSNDVTTDNFQTFADYRGAHICEMHWNTGVPSHCTAFANAKLIAAAPELLESVRQFVWNWENDIWTDADIEAAKAAIKKATE